MAQIFSSIIFLLQKKSDFCCSILSARKQYSGKFLQLLSSYPIKHLSQWSECRILSYWPWYNQSSLNNWNNALSSRRMITEITSLKQDRLSRNIVFIVLFDLEHSKIDKCPLNIDQIWDSDSMEATWALMCPTICIQYTPNKSQVDLYFYL